MTMLSHWIVLVWVAASSLPLKQSEVPRVVLDAVAQKYPGQPMTGFARIHELGRTTS